MDEKIQYIVRESKKRPLYKRPIFITRHYVGMLTSMWPYARTFGLKYYFDEAYRRRCKNRLKKKRYGAGFLSSKHKIRQRLIHRDGPGCRHCGVWAVEQMTIDHIVPIILGGTSELENLQLLCVPCHGKKSANETPYSQKSALNEACLRAIKKKGKDTRKARQRKAVGTLQTAYKRALWEPLLYLWEVPPNG